MSKENHIIFDAVQKGFIKKVREIIEAGTFVNMVDTEGNTPLHVASQIGHSEIVKELINSGADMNAVNANGETALHHARNNIIANMLINKGSDVNAKDFNGYMPIDRQIILTVNAKVVETLINHGAKYDHVGINYSINDEEIEQVILQAIKNDTANAVIMQVELSAPEQSVKSSRAI